MLRSVSITALQEKACIAFRGVGAPLMVADLGQVLQEHVVGGAQLGDLLLQHQNLLAQHIVLLLQLPQLEVPALPRAPRGDLVVQPPAGRGAGSLCDLFVQPMLAVLWWLLEEHQIPAAAATSGSACSFPSSSFSSENTLPFCG